LARNARFKAKAKKLAQYVFFEQVLMRFQVNVIRDSKCSSVLSLLGGRLGTR
jgi:hypothetical protein